MTRSKNRYGVVLTELIIIKVARKEKQKGMQANPSRGSDEA